jgi:hypothetical protein
MATFIWPPEVQWPPPAHILLNYDVVAPGGVQLSSRRDRRGETEEENMTQPFLALITPLSGGHPDQGLPPVSPGYPDQGLPGQPPGIWPSPGRPTHPIAPGGRPPVYPDQGLPGGQGGVPTHPIHIPGVPDQGLPPGETIPPDQVSPPQLPEGYEDDLVVAVKSPGGEWQYTSYDVAPDQGQPAPTPHRRR